MGGDTSETQVFEERYFGRRHQGRDVSRLPIQMPGGSESVNYRLRTAHRPRGDDVKDDPSGPTPLSRRIRVTAWNHRRQCNGRPPSRQRARALAAVSCARRRILRRL
jgi:hypothetical protein